MNKQNDTIDFVTVSRADIDRAIYRARILRRDETRRLAHAVGRQVRSLFGH